MRGQILLITTVFFFALAPPLWSDTLWNKAVRHLSTIKSLPVNVMIEEQFVSTGGKVKNQTTIDATLFRTRDETILFVPHTGYTNGEEIPKVELDQMSEMLSEEELNNSNPFAKDAQPAMQWHPEPESRSIAGHSCQRFTFSGKMTGHQAKGEAWLTKDSGFPLEVGWRIVDVPFKQAETTIKAYSQKDIYTINKERLCHKSSSETTISLEYSIFYKPYGGLILRKAAFSNFRKRRDLPLNVVVDN